MPGSFRRAELRGSDELFRPTRPEEDLERPAPPADGRGPRDGAPSHTTSPPNLRAISDGGEEDRPARPPGRLLRLTDEEIDMLADAVQRVKYPTSKPITKPPIDLFERLEELRKKLLEAGG